MAITSITWTLPETLIHYRKLSIYYMELIWHLHADYMADYILGQDVMGHVMEVKAM